MQVWGNLCQQPPLTRAPSYLVGVGAQGHAEGPGQAKVSQFDGTQLADEQVLWLQVPVDDPVGVAEIHSLQQLRQVALPSERENVWGSAEWMGGAGACFPPSPKP